MDTEGKRSCYSLILSLILTSTSCVLAHAMAPEFGTARKANVVLVKLPTGVLDRTPTEDQLLEALEILIDVFQVILDDVRAKFPNPATRRVVVNISWGIRKYTIGNNAPTALQTWKRIIDDMVAENIVFVVTAGNSGVSFQNALSNVFANLELSLIGHFRKNSCQSRRRSMRIRNSSLTDHLL